MQLRSNTLFRVVDAFFRNWLLFVTVVIGVSATVAVLLHMRNKGYIVGSAVYVSTDKELSGALGYQKNDWVSPAQRNADHLNDLMRDDLEGGFIDTFLREARLAQPMNIDPNANDPRYKAFRKNIHVFADGEDVFGIRLTWPDAQEGQKIVRAMRDRFAVEVGLTRQASAIATTRFLDSQIELYRRRLAKAEQTLIDYKRNHAGQLPKQQEAEVQRLGQLTSELDYLKITAQDNSLKADALRKRLAQITPTIVAEQTMQETPTDLQIKKLQSERAALLAENWRPDSIPVQEKERQLAALQQLSARERGQMLQEQNGGSVTETKLANNPEYDELQRQLTEATIARTTQARRQALLAKQIVEYERRVGLLPMAERDLTEKTRNYELYKKQYEDLLARREAVRIKKDVDTVAASATLRPLGRISVENTAGLKTRIITYTLSVALGLFSGLLLIVMRELLDPSLRYEDEAERLLGVPVLASLPENAQMLSLPAAPQTRGAATHLLPPGYTS